MGPALLKLVAAGPRSSARAWGEGAEWALDQLPRLLGEATTRRVRAADHTRCWSRPHRRYGHFRVGRTDAVFEALAPACIEQVVTGVEAFRAWRLLVREFGEPAPGRRATRARRRTRMSSAAARGLGAGAELALPGRGGGAATQPDAGPDGASGRRRWNGPCSPDQAADRALRSLPGVGPWTSAEVRQRAHGDPDAWSIGDYHVGKDITYALTGEALDDDACQEVLEPYRGHRFRVQTLLGMTRVRRRRRATADDPAHPHPVRHGGPVVGRAGVAAVRVPMRATASPVAACVGGSGAAGQKPSGPTPASRPGSWTVNSAPPWAERPALTQPPCGRSVWATMDSPSPVPGVLRAVSAAVEAVEDVRQVGVGDAGALVGHPQPVALAAGPGSVPPGGLHFTALSSRLVTARSSVSDSPIT